MSSPPTIPPLAGEASATASATPITAAIHRDIIQTHILNRLDGPTLASTSCASSELLTLCRDVRLWRHICNATWPSTTHPRVSSAISSFSSGHRSFYSDSFPAPRPALTDPKPLISSDDPCPDELISAVDIFYDDVSIYSKVLVTETRSPWFLGTPFRLDLLEPKEVVPTPLQVNAGDGDDHRRLRLSWVLINPSTKRAVNVASRGAVESSRHWLNAGEVQLRYATAMGSGGGGPVLCSVLVTCSGGDDGRARVREVSLQVEDMEGKVVPGRDSLVILSGAMEGQRCNSTRGPMERDVYEMFLKMRSQHRERNLRRERSLDMACVALGVLIFLIVCVFALWR